MSSSAVLRFEQLVLSRGKKRVAGPLDLSLQAGERGLVTGPNGSGKTTLVLAVAGLIAPGGGKLSTPKRIGLAPQEPEFPLHQSCSFYFRQLLALGSTPASEQAGALKRSLELFQLQEFADRPIGELSRGWRQRLNLARAWLGEPQLLVLDEPQTALDPSGMDSLTNALDALAKSAVLIVAPEGVGCCDLAPLVLDLKSGVPDLNAKAGAQL
ncbi:MAG: ATP-binding cassette domain-containing protein [Planctomycetes bacterium]|nr:ATP-binding cassette domain-containing protein [Planctomycetota bacterium]MCP4769976.1 ATP-binding cassette domain-containing protein [Planctomycetota bacterium]MCP4859816.1 ATP-binding cassette domain-containing protein [Planctomycetota bacterium]